MLKRIGVDNIEMLFSEIPSEVRTDQMTGLPDALDEAGVVRLMSERAANDNHVVSFLGAGAYEHHIPAPVWEIATRGEFYSAYTPYQAEASQGTLQVIYEYQTMMAGLTGLDVSNASLYDGATAFAEACLMAVRANRSTRSKRILVSAGLHPAYRAVAQNIVSGQGIELVEAELDHGATETEALESAIGDGEFAALALQQPNFLGSLEDADSLTDWAKARGALVIGVVNPVSLALLRPPGEWGTDGADIACGEGQPLGIPLSSGGPYFGFLVTRQAHVRQMPGRVAGRTVDLDGQPGFTLTLQAREQHIRRSRATSNICTNQGLMVTAATIHMSLLGSAGLRRVAAASSANTGRLAELLVETGHFERCFDRAFFHEVPLRTKVPAAALLAELSRSGIVGGLDLSADYPELGNALLVCATECRTDKEMQDYSRTAARILDDLTRNGGADA
jgi:glycine dehydrogenase subunit 1